jgi:hypothetical protein
MNQQPATAVAIVKELAKELLGRWDGRECIEFLRSHDYNWRQMEWIGFYFEFRAKQILSRTMSGGVGPTIGNVTIDFAVQGEPWDFKAHPTKPNDGWIYLNDVEAVDTCALHLGGIGWVIAVGNAEYDTDGSFKQWHDEMKGEKSAYETERIARGAPSRRRKRSFDCSYFVVAKVSNPSNIGGAVKEGLLTAKMQSGQRNSNGKARRAKYGIHLSRAMQVVNSSHMIVFRYPPAERPTPGN